MPEKILIRTNGNGNAWPIPLGSEHPYYSFENAESFANASFSVISKNPDNQSINWEILIDGGHGIIQYLIQNGNRIPEAIVLTHSHYDHTYSVDWVVQSYFRKTGKKYPIYASKLCWEQVIASFPHLEELIEFHELLPSKETSVAFSEKLKLTALPVFHGESAHGASMIVVSFYENEKHQVVFSGDVQIPLLRKTDISFLAASKFLFVDANNRFPNPKTNHWSISSFSPEKSENPQSLKDFKQKASLSYLLFPHFQRKHNADLVSWMDEFISNNFAEKKYLFFSIFDFVKAVSIPEIRLVHYSGAEDKMNFGQKICSPEELKNWTNSEAKLQNLNSNFDVSFAGDAVELF